MFIRINDEDTTFFLNINHILDITWEESDSSLLIQLLPNEDVFEKAWKTTSLRQTALLFQGDKAVKIYKFLCDNLEYKSVDV